LADNIFYEKPCYYITAVKIMHGDIERLGQHYPGTEPPGNAFSRAGREEGIAVAVRAYLRDFNVR
jgi:hypothetical protein